MACRGIQRNARNPTLLLTHRRGRGTGDFGLTLLRSLELWDLCLLANGTPRPHSRGLANYTRDPRAASRPRTSRWLVPGRSRRELATADNRPQLSLPRWLVPTAAALGASFSGRHALTESVKAVSIDARGETSATTTFRTRCPLRPATAEQNATTTTWLAYRSGTANQISNAKEGISGGWHPHEKRRAVRRMMTNPGGAMASANPSAGGCSLRCPCALRAEVSRSSRSPVRNGRFVPSRNTYPSSRGDSG